MKNLLAGIIIGAIATSAVFMSGKKTAPQVTEVPPVVATETVSNPVPPPISSVSQLSDSKSAESIPEKIVAEKVLTKAPEAFVPPLFSGAVDGFPKLDDKTKQNLERIQQKVAANQPEAAIEEMENALKEEPDNAYYAVELALMQADLMKNTKKAEEILGDYLRRQPESKMAAAAYADFLAQHGRPQEATPFFMKAASGPNAPAESHAQLGHNLMDLGHPEKAVESYQVALDKAQQGLQTKASSGESTTIPKQEVGSRTIQLATAQFYSGNEKEARRLAGQAQDLLGPEDPQVKRLNEAFSRKPPSPAGPKKLSE